jgi:hypothetical protein
MEGDLNGTRDEGAIKLLTGPNYHVTMINSWNIDRRGMVGLDAVARAFLADEEITDRDRIAFALRELRSRGYDVEAYPVDWSKAMMICSLGDSEWMAFGPPQPSARHARLDRIGKRTTLVLDEVTEDLLCHLYEESKLYDSNLCDCLAEPYEFSFKGDAAIVDSVFQAVGFATRLGIGVPDDGSESYHIIQVAPVLRQNLIPPQWPTADALATGKGTFSRLLTNA